MRRRKFSGRGRSRRGVFCYPIIRTFGGGVTLQHPRVNNRNLGANFGRMTPDQGAINGGNLTNLLLCWALRTRETVLKSTESGVTQRGLSNFDKRDVALCLDTKYRTAIFDDT